MDLIFVIGMIGGGLWALLTIVEAHEFGRENPWRPGSYGLVLLVVSAAGFWYFMTQPVMQTVQTQEITNVFRSANVERMTFSKPVEIKTTVKSYPWTAFRGSTFYEVSVENK